MALWQDVVNGGIKIAQGIQQMGLVGKVQVLLEADVGERLEADFSKQGQFADKPVGRNVYRSVTLPGVPFIWLKNST